MVVVHGYTSSRRDSWILLAAGMLHRHGFAVLAIDLRNHGDSGRTGGRHTGGVRESADVLGAWDWLVDVRGLPAERIGLFGISLGAASVVIAAGDEPRVAAVWSDSGYGDLDDATRAELRRNHLPGFLLPGGHARRPAARRTRPPGEEPGRWRWPGLGDRAVFVTHGTLDTRLDVHYADQLVDGRASRPAPTWSPGSSRARATPTRSSTNRPSTSTAWSTSSAGRSGPDEPAQAYARTSSRTTRPPRSIVPSGPRPVDNREPRPWWISSPCPRRSEITTAAAPVASSSTIP